MDSICLARPHDHCAQRSSSKRKCPFTNYTPDAPRRTLVGENKARWECEQAHQQLKASLAYAFGTQPNHGWCTETYSSDPMTFFSPALASCKKALFCCIKVLACAVGNTCGITLMNFADKMKLHNHNS